MGVPWWGWADRGGAATVASVLLSLGARKQSVRDDTVGGDLDVQLSWQVSRMRLSMSQLIS
jgi:hypothetical protein